MIESISQLKRLMATHGAVRLYAKKLSPNDNSKNQVYLGGDFSSLNIIPNKGVYTRRGRHPSTFYYRSGIKRPFNSYLV